jgi:hypothetical protein
MPLIPVGNRYTSTMSGSTWKPVICSYCGCKFAYQIKRQVRGEATSWLWLNNGGASSNARKSATESLHKILHNDFDVVSCPDCGMFQEKMARRLKSEAWSDTARFAFLSGVVGGVLIAIGFCLSTISPHWIYLYLLIVILGIWIWLVLKKALHAYLLQPNADAHKRKGSNFSENYRVQRLSEKEYNYLAFFEDPSNESIGKWW